MRKKVKQVLIKMGLLKDISKIENEAMYYRKLFIENPKWNTSFPNEEEAKRWEIIKLYP